MNIGGQVYNSEKFVTARSSERKTGWYAKFQVHADSEAQTVDDFQHYGENDRKEKGRYRFGFGYIVGPSVFVWGSYHYPLWELVCESELPYGDERRPLVIAPVFTWADLPSNVPLRFVETSWNEGYYENVSTGQQYPDTRDWKWIYYTAAGQPQYFKPATFRWLLTLPYIFHDPDIYNIFMLSPGVPASIRSDELRTFYIPNFNWSLDWTVEMMWEGSCEELCEIVSSWDYPGNGYWFQDGFGITTAYFEDVDTTEANGKLTVNGNTIDLHPWLFSGRTYSPELDPPLYALCGMTGPALVFGRGMCWLGEHSLLNMGPQLPFSNPIGTIYDFHDIFNYFTWDRVEETPVECARMRFGTSESDWSVHKKFWATAEGWTPSAILMTNRPVNVRTDVSDDGWFIHKASAPLGQRFRGFLPGYPKYTGVRICLENLGMQYRFIGETMGMNNELFSTPKPRYRDEAGSRHDVWEGDTSPIIRYMGEWILSMLHHPGADYSGGWYIEEYEMHQEAGAPECEEHYYTFSCEDSSPDYLQIQLLNPLDFNITDTDRDPNLNPILAEDAEKGDYQVVVELGENNNFINRFLVGQAILLYHDPDTYEVRKLVEIDPAGTLVFDEALEHDYSAGDVCSPGYNHRILLDFPREKQVALLKFPSEFTLEEWTYRNLWTKHGNCTVTHSTSEGGYIDITNISEGDYLERVFVGHWPLARFIRLALRCRDKDTHEDVMPDFKLVFDFEYRPNTFNCEPDDPEDIIHFSREYSYWRRYTGSNILFWADSCNPDGASKSDDMQSYIQECFPLLWTTYNQKKKTYEQDVAETRWSWPFSRIGRVRITNLNPQHEYRFYAIGGTRHITLKTPIKPPQLIVSKEALGWFLAGRWYHASSGEKVHHDFWVYRNSLFVDQGRVGWEGITIQKQITEESVTLMDIFSVKNVLQPGTYGVVAHPGAKTGDYRVNLKFLRGSNRTSEVQMFHSQDVQEFKTVSWWPHSMQIEFTEPLEHDYVEDDLVYMQPNQRYPWADMKSGDLECYGENTDPNWWDSEREVWITENAMWAWDRFPAQFLKDGLFDMSAQSFSPVIGLPVFDRLKCNNWYGDGTNIRSRSVITARYRNIVQAKFFGLFFKDKIIPHDEDSTGWEVAYESFYYDGQFTDRVGFAYSKRHNSFAKAIFGTAESIKYSLYDRQPFRLCLRPAAEEIGKFGGLDYLHNLFNGVGYVARVQDEVLTVSRTFDWGKTWFEAKKINVEEAQNPCLYGVNTLDNGAGLAWDDGTDLQTVWSNDNFDTHEEVRTLLENAKHCRVRTHPLSGVTLVAGWREEENGVGKIIVCRSFDFGKTLSDEVVVASSVPEQAIGLDGSHQEQGIWTLVYNDSEGNLVTKWSADNGLSWMTA